MIRHIFKKDLRLLWPVAAMLTLLQLGNNAMLLLNPVYEDNANGITDGAPGAMQLVLLAAILLGGAFLIAAIVYQDPIPGVRQDWLVRPVSRTHLLLAKILSVVLLVHVPMFAADLLYAVAAGFPIGPSISFAVSRNIFLMMILTLPLLALASITKNLMEAVAGGFAIAVSLALFGLVTGALHWSINMSYNAAEGTGLQWVSQSAGFLVGFLGALVVLSIQYFRRKTQFARGVAAGVWILFLAVTFFFPWNVASAVQRQFVPQPGAGSAVSLSFDPSIGKFHRTPIRTTSTNPTWYLPMSVDGLLSDAALRADRYSTRAVFASGESRLLSIDTNADFMQNGPSRIQVNFDPLDGASMNSPLNDKRVKSEPMQIEIEMSMTLFQRSRTAELTALSGKFEVGGVGCIHREWSMYTSYDDEADAEVVLSCTPVLTPSCYTLVLHDVPAPYVLHPVLKCAADYKPYSGRIYPGGRAINAVAHLRDPKEVVRYPQNLDHVFESPAALNIYEPVDHFTKTVVIPNIRFNDWTADPTPVTPQK